MVSEAPERAELAEGLNVSRVITGLWQVADLERHGRTLDRERAADALVDYAAAGFDCFDMADHYGSAELIAGEARRKIKQAGGPAAERLKLLTKWCPTPEQHAYEAVRDGVQTRADRLGVACIDLLQLHWWHFDHPGYIDVMDALMRLKSDGLIAHIGVTNFNTDHLHLLLENGFEIDTNQVCLSVLDRRALGDMSALCAQSGVRLLAYGALAGGLLSDRWLEAEASVAINDWSKMKYRRFIDAAGGWDVYQQMLATLARVGREHGVTSANVALRWVLQQPAVGAAIVGARITQGEHRDSNLNVFDFVLSDSNLEEIEQAAANLKPLPRDCGDEYRHPPYLTASGDLSHHLASLPKVYQRVPVAGKPDRWRLSSGSEFEPICGYSRAVRVGDRVLVSGTTATHGVSRAISPGDVRGQAVYILDKISASLESLGASLSDVIRTRIYMKDCSQWEAASRVHGRYFADCLPANTLIEIADLVGPYDIEIEAEAVVSGDITNLD